jgi:hypothetical protein
MIFGRLYTLAGAANGNAFRIAVEGARGAQAPSVAGQPTGDFFVAYQRSQPDAPRVTRVYGQLVDKRGNLSGGELRLSPGRGDAESAPVAAPLAGGGWLVGWLTWAGPTRYAASAAAFSALGNAQGNPVDFNEQPIAGLDLALATGTQGRILAAWDGFDLTGARGLRARAAHGPAR